MRARAGFTLVELLVVIAILALLLALLSPSLGRARSLARAATCLSNLHQIGVGHHAYSSSARGLWIPTVSGSRQWWTTSLMRYIGNRSVLWCPEATRMVYKPESGTLFIGGRHTGWYDGKQYPSDPLDQGSYGQNMWLNHYQNSIQNWGQSQALHFGGTVASIPDPGTTPVVGECHWVGGYPQDVDTPWDFEWDGVMYSGHMMNRFALARHDACAGIVFASGQAEKIYLDDLWLLTWHKNARPQQVSLPWLGLP